NVGLTATPASEVRLLRREGAAWVEVARAALDPLPPGGAREGDLAWGDGALRVGSFDVRVEADPGGLVAADPNRADNVRDGQASFVVALPTGVEV
ncbi:MAG TPA: hypothetical protein VHH36_00620, partial [Candidatus Thermoplasmatota archaeon]|nr:hypothetical protein [Candidatus Thermoplasmatota archaeon]